MSRCINRYDCILLKDIIEHMPYDLRFVKCITRSAKRGSLLLLTTPNALSLSHIIGYLYNRLYLKNHEWVGGADRTHVRIYTPNVLSRLVMCHGFKLLKWHSIGLIPEDILCWLTLFRWEKHLNRINAIDWHFGSYFPLNRIGAGMLTLWKLS